MRTGDTTPLEDVEAGGRSGSFPSDRVAYHRPDCPFFRSYGQDGGEGIIRFISY